MKAFDRAFQLLSESAKGWILRKKDDWRNIIKKHFDNVIFNYFKFWGSGGYCDVSSMAASFLILPTVNRTESGVGRDVSWVRFVNDRLTTARLRASDVFDENRNASSIKLNLWTILNFITQMRIISLQIIAKRVRRAEGEFQSGSEISISETSRFKSFFERKCAICSRICVSGYTINSFFYDIKADIYLQYRKIIRFSLP